MIIYVFSCFHFGVSEIFVSSLFLMVVFAFSDILIISILRLISKISRKTSCHQFVPKQQRNFFASLRWHIVPDDGNSDDEFIKIA